MIADHVECHPLAYDTGKAFDIVRTSLTTSFASGVPAKVAAERLGHADATLFTNLYSHVTPTMQREASERIGAALFGALTAQ